MRVGAPQQFTLEQVGQVLAVIHAPPAQEDLNYGGSGATLTFVDTKITNVNLSLNVHRAHTLSDEFSEDANLSFMSTAINKSIDTTYGKSFNKTTDSNTTNAVTVQTTLDVDDKVKIAATPFTVWEYPVYSSVGATDSTTPIGHMIVLGPDLSAPYDADLDGSSAYIGYAPDHVPGVLLSYSDSPPATWESGNTVSTQNTIQIGNGLTTNTYDTTATDTKTTTMQRDLGLSVNHSLKFSFNFQYLETLAATPRLTDHAGVGSAGGGGSMSFGLSFSSSGQYTKARTSTHSLSWTEVSAITITYPPVPSDTNDYIVTPYIYFTNDDVQCLVVDYAVEMKQTTYWQSLYGLPNPTFNLPLRTDEDPGVHAYTRSLAFAPYVTPDGTNRISITATVANYSLVAAQNVLVEFFMTDPDAPNATLFAQATIISMGPGERYVVDQDDQGNLISWDGVQDGAAQRIWARISLPDNASFNPVVGFNVYPPYLWQG